MAIDLSKLQVTSRDFLAIFTDLIDTIPDLTDKWISDDENDPGIVLVKLMSMYGDMLSYNHDKAVLEVYPDTVTQRKNASQIFGLTGYKMHWYRSAVCNAYLINRDVQEAILPRYTAFNTIDGKVVYTYVGEKNSQWATIPSNPTGTGSLLEVELVQGTPVTPSYVNDYVIPHLTNKEWHHAFNFNVSKSDIVDGNKIYLWDKNVDEGSITLIGDNTEWIQTENIDIMDNAERYYELKVDENDRPFLQLISYWADYNPSGDFKVFYVVSNGEDGAIAANTLYKPISGVVTYNSATGMETDISGLIEMSNDASTIGRNPESCQEARKEYRKYINTHDTFITLSDFTKAVKRLEGVANCYCTDRTCDPNPTDMTVLDLNVYVALKDDIAGMNEEQEDEYKQYIVSALRDNKMIPLRININLHGIHYFTWNVTGKIYTKELIPIDRAQDIIVNLNNKFKNKYSVENMQFNSLVNYVDIVDDILNIDSLVKNVYLEPLIFKNTEPHTDISGETQYLKVDGPTITGQYTLQTGFVDNDSYVIKTIKLDNGNMVDAKDEIVSDIYYPTAVGVSKLELIFSNTNTSDFPRYVLTDENRSIWIYTTNDGKDLSTHGYYYNSVFYYDAEYVYPIEPEEGNLYYDITDYSQDPNPPQYLLYKYESGAYVGQENAYERIEQIPIIFLTVEHDISKHGYYNSLDDEFYLSEAFNPSEIIPKVDGDYYTDDKTEKVYSCDGSTYTLEPDESVVMHTYLLVDQNEDPLDLKTPIRPSKFVIKIDNDRHIIYDNQNGELVSESGIFLQGTINYETGQMLAEFGTKISNATFAYTRNCINMLKFEGIDVNKFYIADECLRKS